MAVGEVYRLTHQGTHCGAPFSVTMSYYQVQPVDDPPGLALATAWWALAGSPGANWLSRVSNKLKALCVAWSSPTDVGAALLDSRIGEMDEETTLPPTAAVMFHLRPLTPWPGANRSRPKYDVGRFYIPGLVANDADKFNLSNDAIIGWRSFGAACVEIDVNDVATFRLVAFPEFTPPPAGEYGVRSCAPDALVRRIATRRPNTCELFAGAGQVGGRPVL
jgi:hypothetical protein